MKLIFSILSILILVNCGSGNNSSSAITIPPTTPPLVVVEPPVTPPNVVKPPISVIEPPTEVIEPQMTKPDQCLTDATSTGDSVYQYITCDGLLVRSDIDFPYNESNTEIAIIDLLAVVDTQLNEELDGGTYKEFVQREIDLSNQLFADSGVYVKLRLAGVQLVEVGQGDLYRQIDFFTNSKSEFSDLDKWQQDASADIAFLFKKISIKPIACGVALYNDLTQDMKYRRAVSQCHINTVFQETEVTRYYERAHETFTHEIGHILGMDHDFESAGAPNTLFPFSYGYLVNGYDRNLSKEYNGYGTIMSYSDLATGRFSDRSEFFLIPETGTSQALGKEETTRVYVKNPATDAVDHLNRVRYYMSQLHEMYNEEQKPLLQTLNICLF
jgi:hypothetical protein